ncbi:MAG: hypothetical protein M0T84_11850 [Betaproteobacteria bacterium]|nr:hypothetical protein [Betaproteobacteria bacterium]
MKTFLRGAAIALGVAWLGGCHTVSGFGQDVNQLGNKMQQKGSSSCVGCNTLHAVGKDVSTLGEKIHTKAQKDE